jgi:hypothetical protein
LSPTGVPGVRPQPHVSDDFFTAADRIQARERAELEAAEHRFGRLMEEKMQRENKRKLKRAELAYKKALEQ